MSSSEFTWSSRNKKRKEIKIYFILFWVVEGIWWVLMFVGMDVMSVFWKSFALKIFLSELKLRIFEPSHNHEKSVFETRDSSQFKILIFQFRFFKKLKPINEIFQNVTQLKPWPRFLECESHEMFLVVELLSFLSKKWFLGTQHESKLEEHFCKRQMGM